MSVDPQAQHASLRPSSLRVALPIGLIITAVGSLWALAEVSAAPGPVAPPKPMAVMDVPAVDVSATPALDPCADPAVIEALDAGDDAAAVEAFGGGEPFRAAIVARNAPCISLDDPARSWVVINKARPIEPVRYEPTDLRSPSLQTTSGYDRLHADAADALDRMAQDAAAAGAGEIGMNNGYRSYAMQSSTYASHVDARGRARADRVSARPGHSEHQSGYALDVVACDGSCGAIEEFGGTGQSEWVAEHAWKYGFIVRYESGETGTTGYAPEPWHLRYLGAELAAGYHEGGFHTLEEFFELPAAPDYSH
ncbi:MAG: M15 family metallopeptidase [Actinomycetota bacterium]